MGLNKTNLTTHLILSEIWESECFTLFNLTRENPNWIDQEMYLVQPPARRHRGITVCTQNTQRYPNSPLTLTSVQCLYCVRTVI